MPVAPGGRAGQAAPPLGNRQIKKIKRPPSPCLCLRVKLFHFPILVAFFFRGPPFKGRAPFQGKKPRGVDSPLPSNSARAGLNPWSLDARPGPRPLSRRGSCVCSPPPYRSPPRAGLGLGWAALGWAGLGWAGLGGLACAGLAWVGWAGFGWFNQVPPPFPLELATPARQPPRPARRFFLFFSNSP